MEKFSAWDESYLNGITHGDADFFKFGLNADLTHETDLPFSALYQLENRKLYDLYLDYIDFIEEFFNKSHITNGNLELNKIHMADEEKFTLTHDFFYSMDKEWFKLFNHIYKDRDKNLTFNDNNLSFSVYFASCDKWLATVGVDNTMRDIVNMVHEYAHGIDDQINPGKRYYTSRNILLELFPYTMQSIFMLENEENKLELNKFEQSFNNDMIDMAQELLFKRDLGVEFKKIDSVRNLSRAIKHTFNTIIKTDDLNRMYSESVDRNMSYVFSYIISQKLVNLYKSDKELFIYTMNKLLTSNEYPISSLEKLTLIKR